MKLIVRISLLSLLVCLFILPAHAQRRRVAKTVTKASGPGGPRTICQGDALPKGFVIVGARRSSKCVELTVKKPAATEIVCDGSPIPDGYSVMKQDSSPQCSAASANPLTNALLISNDGSTVAPAPKASARTNDDEESAGTSVRITVGGNAERERPKSILEQRAEDAQRKARIQLAVYEHKIAVGMTREQVLESWGRPDRISKSSSPSGKGETWWYEPNGHTVWIDFDESVVSNYHADY
jgi:hypothetical protein